MSIIYENYITMLEGVRDVLTSSGFNGSGGTSAEFKYCTNKSNKRVYYKCLMNYFNKLAMVLKYKLTECDRTNDPQKCKDTMLMKIQEYLDASSEYKKKYLQELENGELESSPRLLQKHVGSSNRKLHRKNRRRNKGISNIKVTK
jgi:hypothetical protein